MKKKKPTVSKLKKKLDSLFSEYIRKRDCLATTGTMDEGICVTCGKRFPYKNLQCGHFQSRRHSNTRYNKKNCHAQCVGDNMFKAGEQYIHGLFIDRVYGEGTAAELMELAKVTKRWSVPLLEEMIEQTKEDIKILGG